MYFHRLIVAVAACLLFAGVAMAQDPRTATISFSRPTHYVDGSAIAPGTPLSYIVLQGAKGAAKERVATITGTSTTVNSGLQPGETCFQIIAVANGVESAPSNEGCKAFPYPATEAVIITVT